MPRTSAARSTRRRSRSRWSSATRRTRSSPTTSTPCISGRAPTASRPPPRLYFGIHASELDLSESATLAGLITAPNRLDPFVRPDSAHGAARRGPADHGSDGHDHARRASSRRARADPVVTQRRAGPISLPVLRRLLQAVVPVEPRVRQDLRRPLPAAVHRRPADHDDPGPGDPGGRRERGPPDPAVPGDPDSAITVVDPRTGTSGRWSAARTRTTGRTSAPGA